MIVRYREYCLFIVFNILLLSKSNAQIDTPKLFNEIQLKCDSLLIQDVEESNIIGSHLVFMCKVFEYESKYKVVIKYIYNYSNLKFYKYNYISTSNDCIILYNIDSTIESKLDLKIIKPINDEDTLILINRLYGKDGGYIHSRERPLAYFVNPDGKLIFIKKEEDYIDNLYLLPPIRIEKYKW